MRASAWGCSAGDSGLSGLQQRGVREMMSAQATGRGFGSGKLILFGEHAVVHGAPAVVTGLKRGAHARARVLASRTARLTLHDATRSPSAPLLSVERGQEEQPLALAWGHILREFPEVSGVEVDVQLDLPAGAGLGSSAALAVASARALASLVDGAPWRPDDPRVWRAVEASEGVFHGRASGIDQAAALDGTMCRFQRRDGQLERQALHAPGLHLAICQASPGASTAAMVSGVAARYEAQPQLMGQLFGLVGGLVEAAIEAIQRRDWATIGALMDLNHGALVAMGVSSEPLDAACHVARQAGALGAKLTGAGGGGCVVAVLGADATKVINAWADRGWRAFTLVCD